MQEEGTDNIRTYIETCCINQENRTEQAVSKKSLNSIDVRGRTHLVCVICQSGSQNKTRVEKSVTWEPRK